MKIRMEAERKRRKKQVREEESGWYDSIRLRYPLSSGPKWLCISFV